MGEAVRRKQVKERQQRRRDQEIREKGPEATRVRPEWEVEWNEEEEREALERLEQIPAYQAMSPSLQKATLARVRNNPDVLKGLEVEKSAQVVMADLEQDKKRMPTLE